MRAYPIKDLKHSPLFRGITEDELGTMLDCLSGTIRKYKKVAPSKDGGVLFIFSAADTEILFLDLKRVLTTCSSACRFHTRLIQNLLGVLAEKNLHFSRKIDCLAPHTIRAKLMEYFSQQTRLQGTRTFTIPFNRQQLADYLSVDRSSMTVELYKMKDEGLIEFQKNQFTCSPGWVRGICSGKPMPVFLRPLLTAQLWPRLIRKSCFWI